MEDSKRRAFIKQQATAKKKLEGSLPPKVMGKVAKRKPSKKADHPPKKPKVVLGLIVGETPTTVKLPPSFRKDSQYALKQISSIIKDEDYEDLGNHTIEAIGETGLFSLVQVCLSAPLPLFHPIFVVLTFFYDSCRGSS